MVWVISVWIRLRLVLSIFSNFAATLSCNTNKDVVLKQTVVKPYVFLGSLYIFAGREGMMRAFTMTN